MMAMSHVSRKDLTEFVERLGGCEYVAGRLGVKIKTLTHCFDKRRFTASWFGPLCDLADEAKAQRPPLAWFNMAELQDKAEAAA